MRHPPAPNTRGRQAFARLCPTSWFNGASYGSWGNTTADTATFGVGSGAAGTVAVGSVTANAITFAAPGTGNYTLSGGTITLGGAAPTISTTVNAAIASALAGTVGFTKSGSGTLVLSSGGSSISGGVTISQGTLVANHAAAMGNAAKTLTLGDANTGVGAVGFTIDTGITSTVNLAGINTSNFGTSQTLTLNSGSALVINGNALVTTLNLVGSVPLTVAATNTGGHVTAQDATVRILGSGVAAGNPALILNGTAKALRLTFGSSATPNNFTGDVLMTGAVSTQNTSYNGNVAANQNNGFTTNNVTVNPGGTWTIVWGGETIGALNGSGAVTLFNQTALGNIGLTLGNTNIDGNFSGGIGGPFGLAKVGSGTQTLGGINTYNGVTMVNGGTLLVNGSLAVGSAVSVNADGSLGGLGSVVVNSGGTLSPGAWGIGSLAAYNTVNLSSGATAVMEIKSSGGLLTNDKLTGVTTLTYAGTLTVNRDPASADFAAGDRFTLFSAGSYAGAFTSFHLPALADGLIWDTSRLTNDGSIAVTGIDMLPAPSFNPPAGFYIGSQSITITAGGGSTIYYTTDGSPPTAASPHGPSPITGVVVPTNSTVTIKAYAAASGYNDSAVTSATYGTATTPTWVMDGDGFWSDGSNWLNGVIPSGIGPTADFGTIDLTSDATVTVDAPINLGHLRFGDQAPDHNWTLGSGPAGSLRLATVNGSPSIDVANQTTTIDTLIVGTKGFEKLGEGTLVLSNANTYSGATIVSAGVLEVRAKTSGDVPYVIAQGATLKIGYTTAEGYANTGMVLNGDGVAATTGLYLKGGTSYNASGGMVLQTAPTTIRQYGTGDARLGSFDINDNGLTLSAAASGSVIDSNIQIVSRGYGMSANIAAGAATATGDLVINGPINISLAQGNNAIGFFKRGLGSIRFNGVASADNLSIRIQGGSIITGIDNAIGNNATLVISGGARLVLNGYNQMAGTLSGAGGIVGGATTPATLTINQAGAQTFSGVIGGLGGNENNLAFTKTGAATLTLSGANTYSGATTVVEGALQVDGSVAGSPVTIAAGATLGGTGTLDGATVVNGTLAPGSNGVGTLSIHSSLTLAPSATTLMEIAGNGGPPAFDRVLGVGSLTQGGTLTVTASGDPLAIGDSFKLFAATSYGGAFSVVNLPPGYLWDTSKLASAGIISVAGINQAPVFGGYAASTPYQTPVSISLRKLLATVSDPDGDAVSVEAAGPVSANGGTVGLQPTSISYTPPNNFSGADTFPITLRDARGATVAGTVTVTVGHGPSAGGVGMNPPVLTTLPDGKIGVSFQGIPGRSYIVQRSIGGLDNWVTLATLVADTGGRVVFTDETPPPGSAFYRLGAP